jgi:hypothetical protein
MKLSYTLFSPLPSFLSTISPTHHPLCQPSIPYKNPHTTTQTFQNTAQKSLTEPVAWNLRSNQHTRMGTPHSRPLLAGMESLYGEVLLPPFFVTSTTSIVTHPRGEIVDKDFCQRFTTGRSTTFPNCVIHSAHSGFL